MTRRGNPDDSLSAALEAYFTRLDQGEKPNEQEYLQRFPDCADELRGVFHDLEFLRKRLAEENAPIDDVAPTPGSAPAALGFQDRGSNPNRVMSAAETPGGSRPFLSDLCPSEAGGTGAELPAIPGFRLIHELGSGSQGVVYRAEQLSTRRIVAIKIVRDGAFASLSDRRRFENEVHLSSRLRHSNIVAVYECGRHAGRDYFAMELVEGEPLDLYCSKAGLAPRETVWLFLKVCRAVSYAHQQGVLHRDLKPGNVLVDADGEPHILDFGLAKPLAESTALFDTTLTHVGHFAGTWSYASPEQVRLDPTRVDVRSDVYTLGVILYEMLTDCSPYPVNSTSRETLTEHILKTPPLPPRRILREIDPDLETIVLKTLTKEPEDRYQSAASLADDLCRYLAGEAIEARRTHTWYVLSRLVRRHKWQVCGLAVGLLLLVAFTATLFVLYSQSLAAQATGDVRMAIVRDSHRYTLEKLGELHRSNNVLAAILEKYGPLPETERLGHVRESRLPPSLESKLKEAPVGLATVLTHVPFELDEDVRQWLVESESELTQAAALLDEKGIAFGGYRSIGGGNDLGSFPEGLLYAERLAQALIARGLREYREGNHEGAIENFTSARKLANDLGDGQIVHQKFLASRICSAVYRTYLWIFLEGRESPAHVEPYVQAALSDPPPATLRLAVIAERAKLVQLVAAASVGYRRGARGYLDLDLLDSVTGGLVTASGRLTDPTRVLAATITPEAALDLIDQYIRPVEGWDDLSMIELETQVRQTNEVLNRNPAWSLMALFVPDFQGFFGQQTRCMAVRSAMILFAQVYRYRLTHDVWPEALAELSPGTSRIDVRDPITGRDFEYRLIDGLPVLLTASMHRGGDEDSIDVWPVPEVHREVFSSR